jgi:hypothetical protein
LGLFVKDQILFDLQKDISSAQFLPSDEQRFIHAGVNTISAEVAFFLIDVQSGADLRDGPLTAFGDTGLTIYSTSGFIQEYFWVRFNAFRVVTPKAIERTSFKKNGCAYTGTIMNRVSLDIED